MTRREIADRIRRTRQETETRKAIELAHDLVEDVDALWERVERQSAAIALLSMAAEDDPIGIAGPLDKAKLDHDLELPPVGDR